MATHRTNPPGASARKLLVRKRLLATVLSLLLGLSLWWTFRPFADAEYGPVRPYTFSIIWWELGHAPAKWFRDAAILARAPDNPVDQQTEVVRAYADLAAQLARLTTLSTTTDLDDSSERQLLETAARLSDISPRVELIVQRQLDHSLIEAGFGRPAATRMKWLLPPVNFTLTSTPLILVLSPRDRIEMKKTFLLRPDLNRKKIELIEQSFERRGLSAVIESTGGVATYPSLIPHTASIEGMLATAAHEWFHQYLFFYPLGRRYGASYTMTTINETVANMASKEIAGLAMARYYGDDSRDNAPPRTAPESDFPKTMRAIRTRVDHYLTSGDITGAERFMEEQRQDLATRGYSIRKLNQAYLAFHSSYADEPGFDSAIGRQLEDLRRRSPSLIAFVGAASTITSPEDLRQLLAGR